MATLTVDHGLLDYCTPRQREILEAIYEHGGATAASKVLNCCKTLPAKTYNIVKDKAAKQGYAPDFDMTHPVPDGFVAKGISTYYNSEGKPTAQWVKASVDGERQREPRSARQRRPSLEQCRHRAARRSVATRRRAR